MNVLNSNAIAMAVSEILDICVVFILPSFYCVSTVYLLFRVLYCSCPGQFSRIDDLLVGPYKGAAGWWGPQPFVACLPPNV